MVFVIVVSLAAMGTMGRDEYKVDVSSDGILLRAFVFNSR